MADRELTGWYLRYTGWDPASQPLREALMTLGNGHFATRGALEEVSAGGSHYPGTYLAGGYDRLASDVAGKTIENEDLVNWPNWLPLSFRCDGREWFDLDAVTIFEYEQALDLFRGVLSRHVRFRDREGRELMLDTRRIVNMGDAHAAAIEWVLTPINWSGKIEIRSAIDAHVENRGVARYRDLEGRHLETLEAGPSGEDAIFVVTRTRQSHLVMAQAMRTRVTSGGRAVAPNRITEAGADWVGQRFTVEGEEGQPIRVEKVLSLYSSRDFAISEPRVEACKQIRRLAGFAQLLEQHELAWRQLWHRADLELAGCKDCYEQLVLRLHVFHMLQTASPNTIGRDVGIPARGLHGEAYRGHVFWDELFAFPYLNLRIPELTRSLLLYRYRRLSEARHAAKAAGHEGAMFPWQSGSDGREESQVVHLNPKSGRWIPDHTYRQRHVNAAIAYNVWHFQQTTGDVEFFSFYGAELLLEIARFLASLATYNSARERYEIRGVVGPDEFHTHYPGKSAQGLDNNAYTNVMTVWVLRAAGAALEVLAEDRRDELLETLGISEDDLERWEQISRRMFVPFHDDGIISQFEGWDDLDELDWEGLKERHGAIGRLDRVLEAEDDDVNRYKATKQADVLMLFYLFSAEELSELFEGLGYPFDPASIPRNVEYYLRRTSHGSTLSFVVHAWVLARTDRKRSWHLFHEALASDIDDVQRGTSPEGVHLGAMGGTVDLIQRCYTGIEVRRDVLWLNPRLPDGLEQLRLSIHYRGHWLGLHITHSHLTVAFEAGCAGLARIGFADQIYDMAQGDDVCFTLEKEAS